MTDPERRSVTVETLEPIAAELIFLTGGRGKAVHEAKRRKCPACGTDLMRVGLHKIVYAFAVCDEDHGGEYPHYAHIYEQMWHRGCFIQKAEEVGW